MSSASPDVNLLPPAPTPPPPHHSHKPHGKPGTMGRAACHWGLLGSEARHPGSGLSGVDSAGMNGCCRHQYVATLPEWQMPRCSAIRAQLWVPGHVAQEPAESWVSSRLGAQSLPSLHPLLSTLLCQLAPMTSPDLLAQILILKDASRLSAVLRRAPNHHNRAGYDLLILSKCALHFLDAGEEAVTHLGLQ